MLLHIGTYTRHGTSEGIYHARLDPAAGRLALLGATPGLGDPSFLARHPRGHRLYAVHELERHEGRDTGAVSAHELDPATGALTPLGHADSGGGAPCFVSLDGAAASLLVANYAGGSVARLPLDAEGRVRPAADVARHAGRAPAGPHPERQDGPHAHCLVPAPGGRVALAADLGLDRVLAYSLADDGRLPPADPPALALPPGTGPRHLAFHPDGRTAYLVGELDSTVTVLAWDAAAGRLAPRQTVSTLPPDLPPAERAANTPAELRVHPSGRWLYVSNRGHDSLAHFAVAADGALAPAGHVPSGGRGPRHVALDATGAWLLVANERSDVVALFAVDAATGAPVATGERLEVPRPVCVVA